MPAPPMAKCSAMSTSIINMILETDVTNPIADVNESGIIDVSDVTTVINHILN